MSLSKHEFTNAGRSMLGRGQNGETLTITKIVVGSGSAGAPSDLWPLTALIHQELNVVISSQRDFGNGTLLVEGNFRSDAAPHAFDLKEVGVMAHCAAEADRLYSVANVFTDVPVHIDPAAPIITAFKIKLIIDRIPSANVVVQIGPSEAVTGENVGSDTIGPGFYKESIGNLQRFKRAAAGVGMIITEDVAENIVTFATNQLTTSVDLYVPMSYPNPPAGALMFPTIQAAHDYLLGFRIPAALRATIHLAAGVFSGTGNAPSVFYHPDTSQITLIGQPRVDKTIVAGPNAVGGGTTKNVQLSGSLTDLYVGQPVYLMNTDTGWAGGCYITAIVGAIVTLSVIKRDARATYNINNTGVLGACRLSYFPSIIYEANPNPGQPWAANTSNLICGNNMAVQNLCIIGGYHVLSLPGTRSSATNIFCLGTGGLGATGISGGDSVVVGWPSDIVVTDCDFGLGGNFVAHNLNVNVIANACTCGIAATGVFGAVPGIVTPTGKIYLVHCGTGARNWGAQAEFGNVFYAVNDTGFDAANLGDFIFAHDQYPQLNGLDLYAHGMGFINYVKGAGPTPSCNPRANGIDGYAGSNANSYITVN